MTNMDEIAVLFLSAIGWVILAAWVIIWAIGGNEHD